MYRNPHYKPKTVWRPPQVDNGNPNTNKRVSTWWKEAHDIMGKSDLLSKAGNLRNNANSMNVSCDVRHIHYTDVIMSAMASQITSLTNVYLTIYSGVDERKHLSSASLAFVRGIHRWPVNFPHKGPVTHKLFPFDDAIMKGWYSQDRNNAKFSSNKTVGCVKMTLTKTYTALS